MNIQYIPKRTNTYEYIPSMALVSLSWTERSGRFGFLWIRNDWFLQLWTPAPPQRHSGWSPNDQGPSWSELDSADHAFLWTGEAGGSQTSPHKSIGVCICMYWQVSAGICMYCGVYWTIHANTMQYIPILYLAVFSAQPIHANHGTFLRVHIYVTEKM